MTDKPRVSAGKGWVVYILECANGALYTGITKDMERRLGQHRQGTGAKYTRGRGPLALLYTETRRTRGQALKREAEIKSFSRPQKLALAKPGLQGGATENRSGSGVS